MPGGDRTGPMGLGPMTGRAAGYCAGYPVPGFMNPMPTGAFRGFGPAPYYGGAVSPYGFAGYPVGAYPAFLRFGGGFGRGLGFGRGRSFGRGLGFKRGRGGGWGFRW